MTNPDDDRPMTTRHALPGLVAGALGLVVGLLGFVTDQAFAGVIAGLFALAATAVCVRLASRLEDDDLLRSRLADAEQRAQSAAADVRDAEPVDPSAEEPESEMDVAPHPSALPADGGSTVLADLETGLFNEGFFHVVLETRIASARRHLRPLAVVLIDVVHGLPDHEPQPVEASGVADVLMETLRDADTACRLRNGYFALLLEDTPETGAIWTVERIRRQLVADQAAVTVWAGIACYPAHALTIETVLDAADQALVAAREWRQDRIEVASATE